MTTTERLELLRGEQAKDATMRKNLLDSIAQIQTKIDEVGTAMLVRSGRIAELEPIDAAASAEAKAATEDKEATDG